MKTENSVELLGHYGDDLTIACSAWTSTSRDLTEDKLNRYGDLVKKLWKDGHHSVFEKGIVHFLVNSDIASHIHLLKHRISSANAESARYKELKEDKYYIPEDFNVTSSYGYTWAEILENYCKVGNDFYHKALEELTPILGRKRAKESCRFFKTYNSQIQMDIMFNLRSFANFIKLRYSEHAQKEIKDIAAEMLTLVRNIEGNPFRHALEAIAPIEEYP